MTDIGLFWEIVNWLSLPILAALAFVLLWRGFYREFPFFFWFVLITDIATVVRYLAQNGRGQTYFYAYWITDLVITVFNFLAVYELFIGRLFPRFFKVRFYRYLFPAATAMILFLGWLTALESPHKQTALLIEARVLDFVLLAMLAFFVTLMMVMGRQWTKHDFGIAFGFGINSAAFLLASAAWVRSHYRPSAIDHLPLIAYDLTCLIWLYCFWSVSKNQLPPPQLPPDALNEAKKWEGSLKGFITPGKR
jgi:hypothetical protein